MIVGFIKSNIKLLLRLVSSDIHNKEVSLSATEFNTLKILFKVHSVDGRPVDNGQRPKSSTTSSRSQGTLLSNYTNFFTA